MNVNTLEEAWRQMKTLETKFRHQKFLGSKSTARLPVGGRDKPSRACCRGATLASSAAPGRTVRIRQALASDELISIPSPDVLRPSSRLIDRVAATLGRWTGRAGGIALSTAVGGTSTKSASLLPLRCRYGGCGAHSLIRPDSGAATAGAIRVGDTAARDEL